MEKVPTHLTTGELEQGLADVLDSPRDDGQLRVIFIRPNENQRQSLAEARLSPEQGIDGDRWVKDHWQTLPDGSSDPQTQISLMNSRILKQLSGGEEEAMGLAGDNLIFDLDLSEGNLPDGSRLQIGDRVIIEITEVPHTACGKFSRRYGSAAQKFINSQTGRELNLRGRLARVVAAGKIEVGDLVVKR